MMLTSDKHYQPSTGWGTPPPGHGQGTLPPGVGRQTPVKTVHYSHTTYPVGNYIPHDSNASSK